MKQLVVAVGLASIFAVSATMADPPVTVTQSGLKFSVKDLQVNKGQTVVFLNDDDTSHNITVTGDGNGVSVNGGLQPPGEKFEMPFRKAGTYVVTCGIHPKMRMNIVVKEP
ncbi:MAG: plastocyanin/azurin family copper-binding protein [Steroidobacteraceae bacterium]|jgi:cytochrome c peroxidase